MPTPIPSGEKSAFIAIVSAAPFPGGPIEAERLQTLLVNYEDVFTAICREMILFAANNDYLKAAMAVFTDAELQNVGILNNKTLVTPVVDPVVLINSTATEIDINNIAVASYVGFTILGESTVKKIVVATNVIVNEIYIGPGSEVKYLDGSAAGSIIQTVWLPFLRSTPSRLIAIAKSSIVNNIALDEGSYFGGYAKDNPNATCASPVTDLAAGIITHNTVPLTWTPPPSNGLFTNIYYRKTGAQEWMQADDLTGLFITNGYTFDRLEGDTRYDFRVITVCSNGGWSAPADLTVQTSCC